MTASGANIRPFEPGDLPAMQRIRQAAFAPVFQSFREIVGQTIAALALADADAEQAKLLDDICADGSGHQVLVETIGLNAVHPDHAGRGIGTEMYEYVLARMKEMGVAVATVGTGGDPSHAPARRAYEKAGFGPAIPSVYLYKLL